MANSYQEGCFVISIPREKHSLAIELVNAGEDETNNMRTELEKRYDDNEARGDEWYFKCGEMESRIYGVNIEVVKDLAIKTGEPVLDIVISKDTDFDPDAAEKFARHVVDTLQLDEPVRCTWASWCDKLRPDHFSGGGFLVRRGQETVWVDVDSALTAAARLTEE